MLPSFNIFRLVALAVKPTAVGVVLAVGSLGAWYFAFGALPISGGGSSVSPATATEQPPPRIVFSEFSISEDTLWSAPADDPSDRTRIATIPHAAEYGILASVSPDGRLVAYTVLPPSEGKPTPDAPAEVWAVGSQGGEPRRLATDADLLITPVWSPDSASLVFRRSESIDNAAGVFRLVRVNLAGQTTDLLETDAGVFPVGFSPDGSTLFYTIISQAGSELARVQVDSLATAVVAHLSDDFTRDWHLSPDGERLSFLAPEATSPTPSYQAMVVDTDSPDDPQPLRERTAGDFNPIWHPNSRDLTVGQEPAASEPEAALRLSALGGPSEELEAPDTGFDVPVSWSPDGSYLAVRSFDGTSALYPGREHIVILGPDGERRELKLNAEISLAGWLEER
jgi:dipeptidyl aminopeptidase/acylaminoacyl peptidase